MEVSENQDAASESSSSSLPLALVTAEDYDSFVCGNCVSKIPILKKYAGAPGSIMVVRDNEEDKWRRIGDVLSESQDNVIVDEPLNAGSKRRLASSESDVPEAKRARGSSNPLSRCLAPPAHPLALRVLQQDLAPGSVRDLGTGDVFLTEGFRERWCHCDEVKISSEKSCSYTLISTVVQCKHSLEEHRYLLEEEETYEPPADPDSGMSHVCNCNRSLKSYPFFF